MNRLLTRLILIAALLAPAAALAQTGFRPNDPLYEEQWALELLDAPCAWSRTTGSDDVTVAVVDSGVDMNHPDLVGRLRADGRDFVDGDDDPSDENGHGTNVAGIIAATLDNAEGIAGLAPGVSILPVRVMNARGSGSDRAIARGIRFAADRGAKVINLSLGATLMVGAETESAQVSAAIRYAQQQGALVVVAAGNDFVPLPNAIVGDNPDVLVVAATDARDRKADFSNSGAWISVAAPGVHILSTMPTYEVYLTSDAVPRGERFRNDYDYMSGTSQATPFVAALAALLFSAHPDWDAAQVADQIKRSAADISRQNRRLVEQGMLGSGRIDACAALGGEQAQPEEPTLVAEAPTEPPARPTAEPEAPRPTAEPPARPTAEPEAPRPTAEPVEPQAPAQAPARESGLSLTTLAVAGVALCGAALLALLLIPALVIRRRPKAQPTAGAAPARAPAQAPPAQPAQTVPAWGALVVVAGAAQPQRYPLAGAAIRIGRDPSCAVLVVGDAAISRLHAIVRNDGERVTVEDAGSTHGTFLNGARVTAPTMVRRGDLLLIGQTQLRFE